VNYWLMKSEPDDFSIEDLRQRPGQTEPWTGVRNYQARNYMRDDMKPGDPVLFYHSSVIPPGVAGLAEVASEPFPDPTAFDKKSKYYDPKSGTHGTTWMCVNVKHVETFPRLVTLEEIRRIPGLGAMVLLKPGSRLSIQPVTAKEFKQIMDWIRKHPDVAPTAGGRQSATSAGSTIKPSRMFKVGPPKTKPLPTTKGRGL
jgi:predicted RNA-binding protein with PUA-like domain